MYIVHSWTIQKRCRSTQPDIWTLNMNRKQTCFISCTQESISIVAWLTRTSKRVESVGTNRIFVTVITSIAFVVIWKQRHIPIWKGLNAHLRKHMKHTSPNLQIYINLMLYLMVWSNGSLFECNNMSLIFKMTCLNSNWPVNCKFATSPRRDPFIALCRATSSSPIVSFKKYVKETRKSIIKLPIL